MDSSCHATLQQAHLQLVFHAAVLVLSRKAPPQERKEEQSFVTRSD